MNEGIIEGFNRAQITDETLVKMRESSARDVDNLPIIRENSAALYRFLITALKPLCLLETGTCRGYSAILAAKTAASYTDSFKCYTVELDSVNAQEAIKNIAAEGLTEHIKVIHGDAAEVLASLSGQFDMIFLDSSKSHYSEMLPDVKRLLRRGGVLIADDIAYYGKTEAGEVPHKHRTIVNSLRAFIRQISEDEDFTAVIDTMDDGMLLAVKN
ncbi:MAG: class I SAM-dependent methyltransferase [Clostridia bacterium]|nr:class I SAM-dependent methyltransferase [Clostridia bacterium]